MTNTEVLKIFGKDREILNSKMVRRLQYLVHVLNIYLNCRLLFRERYMEEVVLSSSSNNLSQEDYLSHIKLRNESDKLSARFGRSLGAINSS